MDQPDLSAMDHAAKDDLIQFLLAENAELKSRIITLEVRLVKDSHNSSKPPSLDGLRKPAPKSLRHAEQHPKGRKKGHKGSLLERISEPDQVTIHFLPAICDAFGNPLSETHASEARQIFDIPPQPVQVIDYRVIEARCTCAKVQRSGFPEGGYSYHAIWPTRTSRRCLPHSSPYAADPTYSPNPARYLWGCPVAGCRDEDDSHRSRQSGACRPDDHAVHFDDTGMRVAGKLHWLLHTTAISYLSWVGMHTRRGPEAFDAFDILQGFQGIAIHDGWAPYRKYDCRHGLCNAHHLRGLTLIREKYGQR